MPPFLKTENTAALRHYTQHCLEGKRRKFRYRFLLGVFLLIKHSTKARMKIFHHFSNHMGRPILRLGLTSKNGPLILQWFHPPGTEALKTPQRMQESHSTNEELGSYINLVRSFSLLCLSTNFICINFSLFSFLFHIRV